MLLPLVLQKKKKKQKKKTQELTPWHASLDERQMQQKEQRTTKQRRPDLPSGSAVASLFLFSRAADAVAPADWRRRRY